MPSQDEDNDLPGSTPSAPPVKNTAPPPAAETPAAPVVPPVTPPEPRFRHSAYLTRRALEAGFSQADLDENDSQFIQSELRRIDHFVAQERRQRMPQQSHQPAPAAPAPQPVVEKDPLDEITEADFDPRIAHVAKTAKELRETVKAQNERLKQFEEREQQRTQTTVVETIDGVFGALDPKLYGKGDAATLQKGSPELQRRFAVVRAAGLANGDSPRTIAAKLQAAHNLLYPAAPTPEAAPEEQYAAAGGSQPAPAARPVPPKDPVNGQFVPHNRVQEWADSQTARPTARNGAPEPKGKHAATQAVARRMREQGLDPGVLSEAGEDDDLPG